jgi:hypothetical protein
LTTVSWPSGLVHVAHRGICMPPFLTSLKIPIRHRERNCRVTIDAEHGRVDLIVNLKTADASATKATFENTRSSLAHCGKCGQHTPMFHRRSWSIS